LEEFIRIARTSLTVSREKVQWFKAFVQSQWNRMEVGDLRYGPANKKQKYLTRLKKEIKTYEKTGNAEMLFNAANYCILEFMTPEHPNHHFNNTVKSVTRKET
jgi:hypothetical protein